MSANSDQIPWITWLAGGAAVLVLAVTVVVLLSPAKGGPLPAEAAPAAPAAPTASAMPAAEPPRDLADAHPLDISPILMDARARATLVWESAALVGARLIIDGGRPLGPIDVSYAAARGRPRPGDSVSEKRLRITYAGTAVTQVEEKDRSPARVVPDPNCPLEAAFRAAVQSGGTGSSRYFAVYAHSARYRRPTWTLTAASGATYHVDADNCALIVR